MYPHVGHHHSNHVTPQHRHSLIRHRRLLLVPPLLSTSAPRPLHRPTAARGSSSAGGSSHVRRPSLVPSSIGPLASPLFRCLPFHNAPFSSVTDALLFVSPLLSSSLVVAARRLQCILGIVFSIPGAYSGATSRPRRPWTPCTRRQLFRVMYLRVAPFPVAPESPAPTSLPPLRAACAVSGLLVRAQTLLGTPSDCSRSDPYALRHPENTNTPSQTTTPTDAPSSHHRSSLRRSSSPPTPHAVHARVCLLLTRRLQWRHRSPTPPVVHCFRRWSSLLTTLASPPLPVFPELRSCPLLLRSGDRLSSDLWIGLTGRALCTTACSFATATTASSPPLCAPSLALSLALVLLSSLSFALSSPSLLLGSSLAPVGRLRWLCRCRHSALQSAVPRVDRTPPEVDGLPAWLVGRGVACSGT